MLLGASECTHWFAFSGGNCLHSSHSLLSQAPSPKSAKKSQQIGGKNWRTDFLAKQPASLWMHRLFCLPPPPPPLKSSPLSEDINNLDHQSRSHNDVVLDTDCAATVTNQPLPPPPPNPTSVVASTLPISLSCE